MVMNEASKPEITAAQIRDDTTWQTKAISKVGDAEISFPYLITMLSTI